MTIRQLRGSRVLRGLLQTCLISCHKKTLIPLLTHPLCSSPSSFSSFSSFHPCYSHSCNKLPNRNMSKNNISMLTNNRNMSTNNSTKQHLSTVAPSQSSDNSTSGKHKEPCLSMANINPNVTSIEYAVRGPIIIRAGQIENELVQGLAKPFKQVIRANIGDCHACGQRPIQFLRQVLALCACPELAEGDMFRDDVKERARNILSSCYGRSLGSYSDSMGLPVVREHISKYIEERDGGIPSNPNRIFLANGASEAIRIVMKLLVTGRDSPKAGIMLPVPVYPLYTALLSEYNTHSIPYYLNEDENWSLDMAELNRAYEEAKPYCIPRGIVVINPGNPTGQVLAEQNIRDIIKFAKEKNIYMMADEVYQHNIYGEKNAFHSFKKVLMTMGEEYSDVQLASFMSTSKGYMGECGLRGGYCEVVNMDEDVFYQLNKSISAMLCSTIIGQAAMDVVVNPPRPGEPSYDDFIREKEGVLCGLKEKARITTSLLNQMDGITCNEVAGAMYAFPRLHLPPRAVQEAKDKGLAGDTYYCMQLLEETGICVVPGSGFSQKPGTHHFRMTILPPISELKSLLSLLASFNKAFMQKYA